MTEPALFPRRASLGDTGTLNPGSDLQLGRPPPPICSLHLGQLPLFYLMFMMFSACPFILPQGPSLKSRTNNFFMRIFPSIYWFIEGWPFANIRIYPFNSSASFKMPSKSKFSDSSTTLSQRGASSSFSDFNSPAIAVTRITSPISAADLMRAAAIRTDSGAKDNIFSQISEPHLARHALRKHRLQLPHGLGGAEPRGGNHVDLG